MKIGKFSDLKVSIPGFSVMDRYISGELILPFLFGMGLFTSSVLAIDTLFELIRQVTEAGLPLGIALQVLLLKLPGFIVFAFPMSMLLASLMTYSRLTADSEIIALRSIGVSIYRIIVPAFLLSLFVVSITFSLNNFFAPTANYQATLTLEKALDGNKPAFRKNDNILYREYDKVRQTDGSKKTIMSRLFYAEEFDGEQMLGLTILDRSSAGVNRIITSRSATWNIAKNTWDFFNGTIYLIAPDGSYRNIVRFKHQQLALPEAPLDLAKKPKYDEMNLLQAQEYLKILQSGDDDNKEIRKVRVRIQEKMALPFVCLVFGLAGAALGMTPQNTGKATGFGICIILIFSYYLLEFLTTSMGIWGVLPPFLAAWLPNFLGLGAALFLIAKAAR
ncbi:MAG: LptF/LptG family permease [Xenococcaceae cyanobacterium]